MYALGIRGASQMNTYTKYPMPGPGIELRGDLSCFIQELSCSSGCFVDLYGTRERGCGKCC
jgi:hypothetical protein